ncbi:hypothetical protein LL3_03806 [Bacillus amyloliquefaciens LL3]|nr:hypothetical protein LL3_03806 [Bacillus amyloliquefaciens LL3]
MVIKEVHQRFLFCLTATFQRRPFKVETDTWLEKTHFIFKRMAE